MAQAGWLINGERMTHKQACAYAAAYPPDFDYTVDMLELMWQGPDELGRSGMRTYVSPTMLTGCAREEALKRLSVDEVATLAERGIEGDYWLDPVKTWPMLRGRLAHHLLEEGVHERDSLREKMLQCELVLRGGRVVIIKGTPDKVVPEVYDEQGQPLTWLLLDYKTVDQLETTPKAYWIAQLSCYAWMLAQHGKRVTRARLQQIGMKRASALELELWPLDRTELYLQRRVPRFIGIADRSYNLDHLPAPLNWALEPEYKFWKCYQAKNPWCPVASLCQALLESERARS